METKYNILVCDDEKEIVDAIEIYLMQEGYNVLKAGNGKEASILQTWSAIMWTRASLWGLRIFPMPMVLIMR